MTSLLSEGFNLAMYGMGVVFFFLTLLVLATIAMSRLVGMMEEPPTGEPASPKTNNKKLAAIAAAIHRHRRS